MCADQDKISVSSAVTKSHPVATALCRRSTHAPTERRGYSAEGCAQIKDKISVSSAVTKSHAVAKALCRRSTHAPTERRGYSAERCAQTQTNYRVIRLIRSH